MQELKQISGNISFLKKIYFKEYTSYSKYMYL